MRWKTILLVMLLAAPMSHAMAAEQAPACLALVKPVAREAAVTPDAVAPVACRDAAPAAMRFDSVAGVVVAASDLAAGAYLGRVMVSAAPKVEKGASLTLVSIIGPVRIERAVTAMQSSSGHRVFVRDADGQVYSASFANPVPRR